MVAVGASDAYRILGVTRDATDEQIKQAYRAKALKLHPDKAKDDGFRDGATRRFQELQEAYEAVGTPESRRRFDAVFGSRVTSLTPLMEACEMADLTRVRILLGSNADVSARDATDRTALLYAASSGSCEVLRLLLRNGADVEARNCAGHSCIMFAVGAGLKVDSAEKMQRAFAHLDAVRLLLDEGASVNAATGYGLTALMLASASGRVNMVDLLLQRAAEVTAASDIGLTALVMAADKGFTEVVQRLLKARADANKSYGTGRTPLMGAAAQAHTGVVEALLIAAADVNAVSDDGHTPLLFAVEKGLKDGLVCPIEGAVVEKPEAEATADALLQAAADPTSTSGPKRRTPLHLACRSGSVGLVERLVAHGASLEARDADGESPAEAAASQGHAEVLWVLSAYGASAANAAQQSQQSQQSVSSLPSPTAAPSSATVNGNCVDGLLQWVGRCCQRN
eukprot:TRINITY_DN16844_c0_g1_i1.p1 TRINITY_DN16844_c0_g1~~TRINITY_DN16844_c0_g1_i1.p1  ORF type:complete len:478 (+),score=97.45 TRINITY_DN16844_c0_g1_i1:75-1436(+)